MDGKTIVIVGAGTIGSQTAQHVVRMSGVTRVILVDMDLYEQTNLSNQFISVSDVGKPKAAAQAERLASLSRSGRPALIAINEDIRNVPWGRLQCDVMLSCLDNRIARQYAAEIAWRLGIPLVDAGVRKEGLFARVDVYIPAGVDATCYECSFTQEDYKMLEIHYPCNKNNGHKTPGTDTPSFLGALSAAVQAAECEKILAGNFESAGSRIVISAHPYRCYVSRLVRNKSCFFDHQLWNIDRLEVSPDTPSVHQVLALRNGGTHHESPLSLRFSKPFYLLSASCACGISLSIITVHPHGLSSCPSCGAPVRDGELRILPAIDSSLPESVLTQSLGSTGLRSGDVFSLRSAEGERHFKVVPAISKKEVRS